MSSYECETSLPAGQTVALQSKGITELPLVRLNARLAPHGYVIHASKVPDPKYSSSKKSIQIPSSLPAIYWLWRQPSPCDIGYLIVTRCTKHSVACTDQDGRVERFGLFELRRVAPEPPARSANLLELREEVPSPDNGAAGN